MTIHIRSFFLLLLGFLLLIGTHLTYGIGLLAWIAYVPFLLFLDRTSGWTSRLWFVVVYFLAWSGAVFKISTDPIPLYIIPLFSLPIALLQAPAFLIWARFRNEKWAGLLFAALAVVLEWLQYTFTPFGSWGAAAYTQLDNLVLVQSVSLFGMAGLGLLIYWTNAAIARLLLYPFANAQQLIAPVLILLALLIYGDLRYDLNKSHGREMVKVAAVGTDSEVGAGPLPSSEVRRQNAAILFDRTRLAAASGAELVVWNEAGAGVLPEEEAEWTDSLTALASQNHITLVASYIVPLADSPEKYENKYQLIQPDGTVASTYLKHEPVPGEPAIKGKAPIESHRIDDFTLGGAICYDYDFPYLAQEHGWQRVDIVALPSSDWRGIDPIHTKMAAYRAVEQGVSILRSTRFGLSAAITPHGEMVAQMSSFDDNDRIMLAHLPKTQVYTLYQSIGDTLVYGCMAFLLWFLVDVTYIRRE